MVNGGKLNSVEVTGTNTELTKDAKTAQAVQEISPVTRADADTIKTGKETASPLANGSSANAAIGSPVNSSKSDKDSNSNNKLISPSNELSKSEPCNNEKQNDSTKLGPEQDHLISSIEALKTVSTCINKCCLLVCILHASNNAREVCDFSLCFD